METTVLVDPNISPALPTKHRSARLDVSLGCTSQEMVDLKTISEKIVVASGFFVYM